MVVNGEVACVLKIKYIACSINWGSPTFALLLMAEMDNLYYLVTFSPHTICRNRVDRASTHRSLFPPAVFHTIIYYTQNFTINTHSHSSSSLVSNFKKMKLLFLTLLLCSLLLCSSVFEPTMAQPRSRKQTISFHNLSFGWVFSLWCKFSFWGNGSSLWREMQSEVQQSGGLGSMLQILRHMLWRV